MYVVVASATKAPQGARSPYKRVAVLEVVPGTVPKRIAVGRGVRQIVRTWERLHVGGERSAYARARADAEALAAELNARAGVVATRTNPNWQLNVHSDRTLLASNGPYVTQRAALVDAKELARRRASAQDQRVKTMRTRAGRDAGYKVVDLGGNPTGFFVMPVADKGAELRYNPKKSPVPYLMLWAQRNGGDLKQQPGGQVAATFPSEAAARGFAAELRVYGATGVTITRTGFWPKGPYTFTVEGTLPALTNPKRRTARANHHLAPGQRAAGEVRVVKPLGMRGKADYYIVEGHRLRAEGARKNSGKPRHSWGKLLNKWRDEQSLFHLLKPDGAPACGAIYYASTGPYPYAEEDCYPRCAKCDKRAKRNQ